MDGQNFPLPPNSDFSDDQLNTNTLEHKRPVVLTMLHRAKTQSFSTANKKGEKGRIAKGLRRMVTLLVLINNV